MRALPDGELDPMADSHDLSAPHSASPRRSPASRCRRAGLAPTATRPRRRRAPLRRRPAPRAEPAGRREAAPRRSSCFENDEFDEALAIVDELAKRRGLDPPDVAQIHRFRGYILVSKGNSEGAARGVREVARPARARSRRRAGDDLLAGADLHPAREVRPGARADRHLVRGREPPEARRLLPEGDDPGAAGEVRGGARAREDRGRAERRSRARAGCSCWSRSTSSSRTTRTWRRPWSA